MKTIIYNKFLLQAQEAKLQGLNKLSVGISQAISSGPDDTEVDYSSEDLHTDVYNSLWKLVDNITEYSGAESADSEKLDKLIDSFASDFIEMVTSNLEEESKEEDEEEDEEEDDEEDDEVVSENEESSSEDLEVDD